MTDPTRSRTTERRLDEIREEAARRAKVEGAGAPIQGSSPAAYYDQPLLKAPVWTWEVPAYFFVGGTAGAAAVIAPFAAARGRHDLARDARWIAAAGAALSPPLLISDLGRHDRFLNMLRVFKLQSPMSIGAWTLLAFSHASAASALADLAERYLPPGTPVRLLSSASDALSAATGLVMASYTGVLIGATAIPVWAHNVEMLPVHFAASSVATAASALELAGHRDRALHWMGAAAALIETAVGVSIEGRTDPALAPLKHGHSGKLVRIGGVLSGPVPLALRLFAHQSTTARRLAALSAIAGSAITRWGWLQAGRESARVSRP